MNEWGSWFGLISTTLAVCILAEFFVPKGKIGKSINIILSMFVLSAFVSAINTGSQSFSLKIPNSNEYNFTQNAEKFTSKIEKQTEKLINKGLEAALRQELSGFNINPKKIEIFTDKNEDNCIVMIRCKIYVRNEESRFAAKAKETIEKNLKISTEIIEV